MSQQEHGSTTTGTFPEVRGLRLLQELGRSPKGITYKARRLVEQDMVAAKILRPSRCEKRYISELPRKAEATFVLEHKGLVRSLGCVEEKGRLVLLTDFAPGEPLARVLQQGKPVPLTRSLLLALQCAKALHYAALHRLHHGRLHPSDVILGEDHVRLIGVGLGERPEHAAWAEPEAPPFEPLIYTAPEAMPSRPFPESPAGQAAVDIYSLGAVLCHLVSGTAPFRGTDEGALENERKFIAAPVAWPVEKKARLPVEVVALVDRMLAPEAQARPGYEELVATLSHALAVAEKAEAAKAPAQAAREPELHSGFRGGVRPAVASGRPPAAPVVHTAAAAPAAPQWGYAAPQPDRPSVGSRVYNALLLGLTALVFVVAVALAAKIFVYDALRQPPLVINQPAQSAPVVVAPSQPAAKSQEPRAKSQEPLPARGPATDLERKAEEYAGATRQLEVIQDLLARKEVRQSAGLLKMMNEITEKAGRDTPTGVKALVLARDMEEALARLAAPAKAPEPAPPAKGTGGEAAPSAPPAVADAPPVIPGVGRAGTAQPDKPPAADGTTAAPPAPPQPPAQPSAKTAEAPPTPPSKAAGAEGAASGKLAGLLKGLLAKARACQYTELSSELSKLTGTVEGDEKGALETYAGLAKREQDLFKRCRKWLLDEIQRRPRHDSPLQVFPRKNEPGDDIVDFDETGLKIQEKRPAGTNLRTLPWEKTPPAQACALLQLTSDKNSAEDHLALAVCAFSRGLKTESGTALNAARGLAGGREKAAALEEQLQRLGKILESPAPDR